MTFSRALLLVSCVALAAAKKDVFYRNTCGILDICGGKEMCCVAGTMDMHKGTCTYSDGTSCYLCTPVDGLKQCDEPKLSNMGVVAEADGRMTLTSGKEPTATTAGAGNGLTPTYPNSAITLTIGTYNGMAGWLDIPAARFFDFKEFLQGLVATIPSFYTKAGFRVKYLCNSQGLPGVVPSDFQGCNIFLFAYRCPPCDSRDGNIGSQLLSMADPIWFAGNCGPIFKLNPYGYKHQFAVYSAEVEDYTVTTVELEQDVEFMFWALVGKSVVCQAKSESECKDYPVNCYWDGEMCRWRDCYPTSMWSGPSTPRCEVCVDDEEKYIPEVLM